MHPRFPSRPARVLTLLVLLVLLTTATITGCGSSGGSGHSGHSGHSSGSGRSGGDPEHPTDRVKGTIVEIEQHGGHITPQGKALQVRVGQAVSLQIRSDRPGELHVHSTPEQHIEYPAGRSTRTLRIEQPGLVDVESHTLDALVLRLQVR